MPRLSLTRPWLARLSQPGGSSRALRDVGSRRRGARTLGRSGAVLAVAALILIVGCGDGSSADDGPARADVDGVIDSPATGLDTRGADAKAELTRIATAERKTVFTGWKTATYGPAGGRQTRMKVTRLADGRTFMSWEQQGKQALRWVYRSRHRWIDDPSLLASNYDIVEIADQDATVAWRPTRVIEVRPRHPGRPSMTMMVDVEHGLVLCEEIRDFEGVARFSWHFDTIDFDPDEAPEDLPEGTGLAVRADEEDRAGDVGGDDRDGVDRVAAGSIQPERLPAGFRLVDRKAEPGGGVAEYFSDGLAAFVIRQRPAPSTEDPPTEGELTCRTCSGRSQVSGTFAGVEVSILGNLPLAELETLAESLRVGP